MSLEKPVCFPIWMFLEFLHYFSIIIIIFKDLNIVYNLKKV